MTFMAWPEIQAFHNIRKYTKEYPEILKDNPIVAYKCKVKLHGTNAAVQVHTNGTVVVQSRENVITPEKDNAGFARFVMTDKDAWHTAMGYIIYGEWCGPGVQKGVAISEIPKKIFAVFAARLLDDADSLVTEPSALEELVEGIPYVYVLPWYEESCNINWNNSSEDLTKSVDLINGWVQSVEANDPWVEKSFGVKGTGEGLVFYPVSPDHLGHANFVNLTFKAKGEKHKNITKAAPAQVDASSAASINEFVDMVVTTARLEQGATKVSADGSLTFDMKNTGKFVSWLCNDVEKETKAELEASNLTWKQVQKTVNDKARSWYLEQAKKL